MGYVKNGANQHIGSLELKRQRELLEFKYNTMLKNLIDVYGVVKNLTVDPSYNNLKISNGTASGKFSVKAGYAIDKNLNLIVLENDIIDAFDINPLGAGIFEACIAYAERVVETGTVNIANNGAITGTGTEFTKLLRGQPYHPSKIKFTNAVSNLQEYEVLSVTSDTSAILQGASFVAETNLKYQVIGTFTPGVIVPNPDKGIFVYDSCVLSIKVSPAPFAAGLEFKLASLGYGGVFTDERNANEISLI